jgi:hypothetical protein
MNRPRHTLALTMLLFTGAAIAQERAAAAGWLGNLSYTIAGTASWVENLSRTSAEPFRKDAATYELELSATHRRQLAPAWLLHATADAAFFTAPDYDLADHARLGARLGLQRKFGLGPLAPVLQFDTALACKAARLHADRGWTAEAGLRLAKRFTETFQASLAGQWLEHRARRATFDLNQHSLTLEATWDFAERWSLNGSAGRLSGDIVANAAWSVWAQAISGGLGPTVFAYYTSRPWEVTELYGPGWVSYNVEADVDLWSLAANYSATQRTTVELRYRSAFVVNRIGVRYPTDAWSLALSHRF